MSSPRLPSEGAGHEADADDAVPAPQASDDRVPDASTPTPPAANETAATHEEELHRCFICLGDEQAGSLPVDWVTPCTCTLEGHQMCLLTWVADLEAQGKDIDCPQCKSRITVLDRWDPVVYLGDAITRQFSRVSPLVLAGFAASGFFVANAMYGLHALEVFAGPDAALQYLTRPQQPVSKWGRLPWGLGRMRRDVTQQPALDALHIVNLSLIGPALILNRMQIGQLVMLPASLLYGAFFTDSGDLALAWPPSPHQALVLFPSIKSAYFRLYRILSKRIDRKLRSSTAHNVLGDAEGPEAAQDDPAQVEQPAAEEENVVIQIDLQIGADDEGNEGPLAVRADNGPVSAVASISNYLAGALFWPSVSYGMGTLLQAVLPKAWVTRPASGPVTGMLQERWGRSLVGGCLFVVIKDAFYLYVKYRRALIRPHRRIQNADRRVGTN